MGKFPKKVLIAEREGDSRTAHLLPLIAFFKAQGNEPAGPDGFTFDRDGYGDYRFSGPLDMEVLKERFEVPATLLLNQNSVQDTRNFVGINQHVPQGPPLTFDY